MSFNRSVAMNCGKELSGCVKTCASAGFGDAVVGQEMKLSFWV
jgi:hypothetical protein